MSALSQHVPNPDAKLKYQHVFFLLGFFCYFWSNLIVQLFYFFLAMILSCHQFIIRGSALSCELIVILKVLSQLHQVILNSY